MSKKSEVKIKNGDIFTIPIDENRIGHGWVIATRKHNFLLVVFEGAHSKDKIVDLENLVHSEKLLMGKTLDGKIYNKHWIIIGNNVSSLNEVKLPLYKIGGPGEFRLVDFNEKILGNVDDIVGTKLFYETVTSPALFEEALKAHHGIGIWEKAYDELLFNEFYSSYENFSI